MNVLIVVADALRKDRVGCLGGRSLTPDIDDFAEDAVRFTNAFTTANCTDMAVTSIQTGRYPISHGIMEHAQRVTDTQKRAVETVPQLPEVLSEDGYSTAKFGRPLGRWHRNGFDIYPDVMEGRPAFDRLSAVDSSLVDENIERVKSYTVSLLDTVSPELKHSVANSYNRIVDGEQSESIEKEDDTQERDETVEKFRQFVESQQDDWFSFVHFMDTHSPYDSDPELVLDYLERFDYFPRPTGGRDKAPSTFHNQIISEGPEEIQERFYFGDEPSSAITDAHYDGTVTETNNRFRRLIEILDSTSELDETLIVFLADHGESLTEQGIRYTHHGLYESLVRIPLIIRPPGGVETNREIDDLVSIIDIAPTVVEYTDADGLDPDGYSLKPLIEGETNTGVREYVMTEDNVLKKRMIRNEDTKYIRQFAGEIVCRKCGVEHAKSEELYHLDDDPSEQWNKVGSERQTREKLQEEMDERVRAFKDRVEISADRTVEYEDEEIVHERMKALGYR